MPIARLSRVESTPDIHGRIRPDGRAGFAQERTTATNPVEGFSSDPPGNEDESFRVRLARQHGTDVLRKCLEGEARPGSSNASNSRKNRKTLAKRGSKGLTSHGKALIMNACGYLSWRFHRRSLSFATVTLPAMNKEQWLASVEGWSAIVKNFVESLRRKLSGQNLPDWIVGAFETQQLRGAIEGRPVLHFHFIFVGRVLRGAWRVSRTEIRALWRRAVLSRIPSLSDSSFSATENVQGIKRSVAAYLSKYISKGDKSVADVAAIPSTGLIASWYTCSLPLRRVVSRSTRSGRFIGAFLSRLCEEDWLYKRAVKVQSGAGHPIIVGYFGQLKPGWSQLLDVPVFIPIEENDRKVFQFPFQKNFHDGFAPIALNVGLAHYAPILERIQDAAG